MVDELDADALSEIDDDSLDDELHASHPNSHTDHDGNRLLPSDPCPHPPGTEARIAWLAARIERGELLWHPDDVRGDQPGPNTNHGGKYDDGETFARWIAERLTGSADVYTDHGTDASTIDDALDLED